MHLWTVAICCAVLAGTGLSASAAEPVRDSGSGLAVAPPEGYVAAMVPPRGKFEVMIEVQKASDADRETGCYVAFMSTTKNADYTQEELNEFGGTDEWRDVWRSMLALAFDVQDVANFEYDGVTGILVLAGPKEGTTDHPFAGKRVIFYVLETPKGRTTVNCAEDLPAFDRRLGEFESVLHGVTLPR